MNAANRSTFVTVVAWIFIALSAMGTLMGLLQNVMIHSVLDSAQFEQALRTPPPDAPAPMLFMLGHFKWILGAFLLYSLLKLAASIGLLLRRNWARLLFVGLLALAIVWQVGGLAWQYAVFSSMQDSFAQAPGAPDLRAFFVVIGIVGALFALFFAGLFAWIAKRLLSPAVAAEFRR